MLQPTHLLFRKRMLNARKKTESAVPHISMTTTITADVRLGDTLWDSCLKLSIGALPSENKETFNSLF